MNDDVKKVLDLIDNNPIAMLTTVAADGSLESRPMARQKTEFDGNFYFITQRGNDLSQQVQANPHVNLAFAKMGEWVSVQGTASIVNDEAKLKELWDTQTDAWTKGGPEDPENVLLVVKADGAHYWDSPAAPIMLVSMLKAKVTGGKPAAGDSGSAEF